MTAKQFFTRYRNLQGAKIIGILMNYRGREMDVHELCSRLYHTNPVKNERLRDVAPISHLPIPMVDLQTVREYRKRIATLTYITTQTREDYDATTLRNYEAELEAVKKELRNVTCRNGRIKNFPLEGNKAYHAVLNSIKRLKRKAADESCQALALIERHVHTGAVCYIADCDALEKILLEEGDPQADSETETESEADVKGENHAF